MGGNDDGGTCVCNEIKINVCQHWFVIKDAKETENM